MRVLRGASIGTVGADDPVYGFLPRFAASRGLPSVEISTEKCEKASLIPER